jgi:hypothetical protein
MKSLAISLAAIAAQAGWHTVLSDAQAAMAQGSDMVDRLGGKAAVETAATREVMQGATPAACVGFGAEIFQENTIPGQHADASIGMEFALAFSSGNVSLTAVFWFADPSGHSSADAPRGLRSD